MKIILVISAVVLIFLGYFVFNGKVEISQDLITETDTSKVLELKQKSVSSEAQKEIKEFVVSGTNFMFSLGEIRVAEGDNVRIIFKNGGGIHDWKIDELNVATKIIQAGEEDVIEFIASKKGVFEYYCSVGNHREMGMRGKLIVE